MLIHLSLQSISTENTLLSNQVTMVHISTYDNNASANNNTNNNTNTNTTSNIAREATPVTWDTFCMNHWDRFCSQQNTDVCYDTVIDSFPDYLYEQIQDHHVYTVAEETFMELPEQELVDSFVYWRNRNETATE